MNNLKEMIQKKNDLDQQKREIQADIWRLEDEIVDMLIEKRMHRMLKINWTVLQRAHVEQI